MDIIVCLKQKVDMKQIRIKRDTREAVIEGLPLLFGDMDRNALEEAVKLKEKAGSGKVVALAKLLADDAHDLMPAAVLRADELDPARADEEQGERLVALIEEDVAPGVAVRPPTGGEGRRDGRGHSAGGAPGFQFAHDPAGRRSAFAG